MYSSARQMATEDLPKLQALVGVLEERGEALLALRAAMEHRDEGALIRSLQASAAAVCCCSCRL